MADLKRWLSRLLFRLWMRLQEGYVKPEAIVLGDCPDCGGCGVKDCEACAMTGWKDKVLRL